MDCSDCLSVETVVLLMTDGFIVFHVYLNGAWKEGFLVCAGIR